MSLTPYTRLYDTTDGSFVDHQDILDEFDRIQTFIEAWTNAYNAIGATSGHVITPDVTEEVEIFPINGLLQTMTVASSATDIDIKIHPRGTEQTHRVYVTARFRSKSTTFTVTGPDGHVFGINRYTYLPGQVVSDGFYNAVLIITYGSSGTFVQVYAGNPEATSVDSDDVLSVRRL